MIFSTLSLFDDTFLRKCCPNFFKDVFSIPLENKQAIAEKRNEKQSQSKHLLRIFLLNCLIQVTFCQKSFNVFLVYVDPCGVLFLFPLSDMVVCWKVALWNPRCEVCSPIWCDLRFWFFHHWLCESFYLCFNDQKQWSLKKAW